MPDRNSYLSIAKVALYLDCGKSTVADYVDRQLLPQPRKIGGLTRWKWGEIEDRIDNLASKTNPNQSPDNGDPILASINGG